MMTKFAILCNPGGRDHNDDTVRIERTLLRTCAFVGDGLGAYAGGQLASQTAAQVVMDQFRAGSLLEDAHLLQTADLANDAVHALQKEKNGSMKTTLVLLTVEKGKARWMHIGDSRLYHFKNGKLQSQTTDHSVSQVAALMGDIKQEDIRFHEDRNKVLRALGSESAKPELSQTVSVKRNQDVFLLCTDGFWEYVYENEMEQLLQQTRNPKKWLAEMEKLLLTRVKGENDNYTAAAIFC